MIQVKPLVGRIKMRLMIPLWIPVVKRIWKNNGSVRHCVRHCVNMISLRNENVVDDILFPSTIVVAHCIWEVFMVLRILVVIRRMIVVVDVVMIPMVMAVNIVLSLNYVWNAVEITMKMKMKMIIRTQRNTVRTTTTMMISTKRGAWSHSMVRE